MKQVIEFKEKCDHINGDELYRNVSISEQINKWIKENSTFTIIDIKYVTLTTLEKDYNVSVTSYNTIIAYVMYEDNNFDNFVDNIDKKPKHKHEDKVEQIRPVCLSTPSAEFDLF